MNSKIKSIVFNKNSFLESNAREWFKQNKYKISKVDSKSHYYKFKQLNPAYLKRRGFNEYEMKEVENGIYFILAFKGEKEGGKLSVKHIKGFINNS